MFSYQPVLNPGCVRFVVLMDLRNVHIHADSRGSPLTIHDSHGGDNID